MPKLKLKKREKKSPHDKHDHAEGIYKGDFVGGKRHGRGLCRYVNGAVYSGSWVDDNPSGYGSKSFPSGDRHEGYYQKGRRHGWGFYLWVCGDKYSGDWVDGNMHGNGCFSWNNGDVYMGDWRHGKMEGRGVKTCADGSSLKGQFCDGHLDGFGVKTFIGGDQYTGQFNRGSRHGFGTYRWSTGDEYVGEWVADRISGKGHMVMSSSARKNSRISSSDNVVEYRGFFEMGERHGTGVGQFNSGAIYHGEWAHDVPHGWGCMAYPCGDLFTGSFEHGKIRGQGVLAINQQLRQRSQEADNDNNNNEEEEEDNESDFEYRGEWMDNLPEGVGVMRYLSGQVYQGSFVGGLREGPGQLLVPQGARNRREGNYDLQLEVDEAEVLASTNDVSLTSRGADESALRSTAMDGLVVHFRATMNGQWIQDSFVVANTTGG